MPSFNSKSNNFRHLLLILDLAIVAMAFVWSLKLYPMMRGGAPLPEQAHLGLLPIALLTFFVCRSSFFNARDMRRQTVFAQSLDLLKEMVVTVTVLISMIFLFKFDAASRFFLATFAVLGSVLLLASRRLIHWWYFVRQHRTTDYDLRVLIVGSGRRARMLADQLQMASDLSVNIVGFLDPRGESAGRRADDEIIGHVNQIQTVLCENVVDDVIVAVPRSMIGDVQDIIDACQEEGVRLRFMADIYDFDAARIRLNLVNDIPLLSFEPVARAEGALVAKRIFDLVLTLTTMPILLPLMGLVAVLIRLDSPGPAIFKQDRVGLHKRRFKMYKFRSMVVDAEARMAEVEHLNEAQGPNFKIDKDPRVTRIGSFLRRSSIDELPQLFNVILGDMSLVGPRPMSLRDVSLFDKGLQRRRFSVRPGITCLWQISGRSDLSFDEWLELDLRYIDSWTFWLDIRILLKTIPAVFWSKGAA